MAVRQPMLKGRMESLRKLLSYLYCVMLILCFSCSHQVENLHYAGGGTGICLFLLLSLCPNINLT